VLLDALAHSHARGVIHRDLKPGNVLLRRAPMSDTSGRAPEPLITDFGVAQAFVDGASGTREVVGTPAYMAPEQLQARWRDQGPWTDLYSMGCLAWSLATGTPPFGRGRSFEENRAAHLEQEPPPFVPLMDVPPGLEGWLRRLLQKDPAHRYVRAADAMLGLLGLPVVAAQSGAPRPPAAPVVPAPAPDRGPDTLTLTPLQSQALHQPLPPRPLSSGPAGVALPPRVVERPIPADWQRPRPPALPPQLLGVGLSLYGLREVPLVNRVDEREALWAELCAVGADSRPRAVLLQGPSGCGVTRLANWLAERAHELGAATVLSAVARNDESAGGEVGRMLAAHLRVEAMSPSTRQRRLNRLLSIHGIDAPDVRRAMAELVGPGDGAQTAPSALAHPSERYRLLTQLLRAIATGPEGPRPLVVLLDDAQWSPDGLELTRRLLDAADEVALPVLMVLTAGSDGLPERPALRRLFDAVRDHPRTRTVSVQPLSTEHQTELVRLLLGMDGALAARVVRRSAGNPHFAVELIRDWVQEGKLQIGPDGFELQPFADVEMPKDLQQTWRTRSSGSCRGSSPKRCGRSSSPPRSATTSTPTSGTPSASSRAPTPARACSPCCFATAWPRPRSMCRGGRSSTRCTARCSRCAAATPVVCGAFTWPAPARSNFAPRESRAWPSGSRGTCSRPTSRSRPRRSCCRRPRSALREARPSRRSGSSRCATSCFGGCGCPPKTRCGARGGCRRRGCSG